MSNIQAHMPSGSVQQQAAAWELIVASIILVFMIVYRWREFGRSSGLNIFSGFSLSANYFMKEGSGGHVLLYIVLFALVFSSAMSFFT